ncbi:multicopper oxidase family protein [Pseudaestuariivita atlantica]|uniref:Copper oxidase n=1 Tax=Pseudaestuariivita atlantica TaxID=1317121 RepID=A0A0L1JV77_9RHOB|nr:multicopper oxidase family protein [Pseudaestuariivita atlantica]KNG95679.1 copper oxidase [Pseudaestuariivita atlantica]
MNRRQVLLGGAALAAAPTGLLAQSGAEALTARAADMQLLPAKYGRTRIWGFDGTMPGPVLRVPQGGRVQRTLVNELPQATSIHWHGIRIDNAMDGVSGLTQEAVAPGGRFDYDFVAPDAGTYWYHAHNRSVEQVARGLYGALIVEEPVAPDVDEEDVLVLDDWLIDPATAQIDDDFEAMHDRSHAGRNGNFIAANGVYALTKPARQHERRRLRIINAANARIFELRLQGLDGWIMAYDGMPLAAPQAFGDYLLLGPGQRADVFVDVIADEGGEAHLLAVLDGQGLSQVKFDVTGRASLARRGMPTPLQDNTHDMVRLDGARQLTLDMEGGAMGGLRAATLDGKRLSFRRLVNEGQFWAFNGAIGRMEDAPLAQLERGEHVRLKIRNDTAFPHAMHLHGMHFHEIGENGALGPLRDTTLIFGDQTREIAFVADNPGNWLFHCHMLSHAASGMTTRIEVA